MPTKKKATITSKKLSPKDYETTEPSLLLEEITVKQARNILDQKGFRRLIQVVRDPRTGHIIDLRLTEIA